MWRCTKEYMAVSYFCLIHKLISDLKAKGNVRVYSKALYIYTLADSIVDFLRKHIESL